MNALTAAIYTLLAGDAQLAALLATYNGAPAVFTTDPAPGDATLPYIVSAGNVADAPFDTKTGNGRQVWRDVRCYAAADGSAVTIEAIGERVRQLLHRASLTVDGFNVFMTDCSGPSVADEPDAYGRIVSVRLMAMEV